MINYPTKENLWILLGAWLLLFAALLFATWRSKRPGVGLPLVYVFSLSLVHFPGALCYAMPGYTPTNQILIDTNSSLSNTFVGFRISLIGLVSLVIGWFLANAFVSKHLRLQARTLIPEISAKMPRRLLVWSIIFFFFIAPIFRLVPSLGSLGTAGTGLSIVAATLGCWQAWLRRDTKNIVVWFVGASMCFPIITLISMGFLSFGVAAALIVWFFVFAFYRPRWISILLLITLTYSGITLYVNYMRERTAIRRSVWGDAKLSNRVDNVANMFVYFEPLNLRNQNHLEAMDARLNQNQLIGICQNYLEHSSQGFAHGSTLYLAAVSVIPRIIWPDKPITGGGKNVAAQYTGMEFGEFTSVGVGQILEFYINFGVWFVVLGMMVFGYALRWFDIRAGLYLYAGDYWSYTRWFVPAMGLLQPQGSLAEVTGSIAAGAVFVYILHHLFFSGYYVSVKRIKNKQIMFNRGTTGQSR